MDVVPFILGDIEFVGIEKASSLELTLLYIIYYL